VPSLSLFDEAGQPLADGTYTWELRSQALVQSGTFRILAGAVLAGGQDEPRERGPLSKDQMVPDDLIVDGKGCIGLGCAPGEGFGGEALRLKQSVVRLRFEDTSATAGFPSRDWQLTVNDPGSGGADKLSIEDLTAGTVPFTLRGGAPSDSLSVDGTGRVGLGTAVPSERFHVFQNADANTFIMVDNVSTGLSAAGVLRAKSDSATVNFQAHGSGRTLSRFGQPLASWAEFLQVGGNGLIIGTLSAKPLILGTGSANRLHITGTGEVGIGTTGPTSRLHVNGGDIRVTGGSFIDDGVTLNAPDYVFDADYRLMPLAELGKFVEDNKRLPNVPSAAEIKAQGVDLGAFQMRLLEKIEELALYTLEQEKKLEALRAQNAALEARLARLEGKP
jgi:hypothetical protein